MHLARLQASASNLHLLFSGLVSAFALCLPSDVDLPSCGETYKIYHYLHYTVILLPVTPHDVPEPCLSYTVQEEEEGRGKEGKNIIMGARKKMVIVIIHKNVCHRTQNGHLFITIHL